MSLKETVPFEKRAAEAQRILSPLGPQRGGAFSAATFMRSLQEVFRVFLFFFLIIVFYVRLCLWKKPVISRGILFVSCA